MPTICNRWRVFTIKPDGSVGVSFFCVTAAQRAMIVLALHTTGQTFMVEGYAV